jgi:hypothetical protein
VTVSEEQVANNSSLDIDTIERQIFGGRMGRMKWTAAASPLSRHHRNEHGECIPDDPTSDPYVAGLVEKAKTAGPGEQRIFTLVDTGMCHASTIAGSSLLTVTGNMTATLFQAERPPVCFIMVRAEHSLVLRLLLTFSKCGAEGGMKRIVGCSYDWTTATFYRETVLRIESKQS